MQSFLSIVFLLALTLCQSLTAQEPGDELDPLMGSYILGNSAEMIMQCAPTSGDQGWRIFDYQKDPAAITGAFSDINTDPLLTCIDLTRLT